MEKFCQNCGMPIFSYPQLGGLIANLSKENCRCYNKIGQLNSSEKVTRESQSLRIEKMKKEGMPKFLKWLSKRGTLRF